jgi:hypothetical protein
MNYISLKIPHFSTVSAGISGTGSSSSSSSSSNSSSSSSSSSSGSSSSAAPSVNSSYFWELTYSGYDVINLIEREVPLTKEIKDKQRIRLKINNELHYVGIISASSSSAVINISSKPQQATIKIGEVKKFDVDENEYYDLEITLNSINSSKINLTMRGINEKYVSLNEDLTTGSVVASNEITKKEESVSPKSNNSSGDLDLEIKSNTKVALIVGVVVLIIAICLFGWAWFSLKDRSLARKVRVKSP